MGTIHLTHLPQPQSLDDARFIITCDCEFCSTAWAIIHHHNPTRNNPTLNGSVESTTPDHRILNLNPIDGHKQLPVQVLSYSPAKSSAPRKVPSSLSTGLPPPIGALSFCSSYFSYFSHFHWIAECT